MQLWVACIGMCCSFGLAPAQQLNVPAPLMPNQSNNISLPVSVTGVVQRMDPLTNLQVSVFYLLAIFTSISVTLLITYYIGRFSEEQYSTNRMKK